MSYQDFLSERELDQENDCFGNHPVYSIDNKEEPKIQNQQQSLISIQIEIGDNQAKELKIDSIDDVDKSINNFCKENNLPKEAKNSIKNLLLEEIEKKIMQCKSYYI